MCTISAREFQSNQSIYFQKALNGEEVVLKSDLGSFLLQPISENVDLTKRLVDGLKEVKKIREGKSHGLTIEELFDGL